MNSRMIQFFEQFWETNDEKFSFWRIERKKVRWLPIIDVRYSLLKMSNIVWEVSSQKPSCPLLWEFFNECIISFISDSSAGSRNIDSDKLSFKYVVNCWEGLGIFAAKLSPTLAKKALKLSAIVFGSLLILLLMIISSILLLVWIREIIELRIFHVLVRLFLTLFSCDK